LRYYIIGYEPPIAVKYYRYQLLSFSRKIQRILRRYGTQCGEAGETNVFAAVLTWIHDTGKSRTSALAAPEARNPRAQTNNEK
jgi:hypothetical protein